jgi:hypothetical protein
MNQRGLSIEVLDIKNKYLLNKWLFNKINDNDVWQERLQNNFVAYKKNQLISPFGGSYTRLKMIYFDKWYFKMMNGANSRFWKDTWLDNTPLGQ